MGRSGDGTCFFYFLDGPRGSSLFRRVPSASHTFFSFLFLRSSVTASVAQQVSRSHDLRYFPPPPYFLSSPPPRSRLAPGHYLIFRLETPHPQEKRSDRGKKAGRESPLVAHAEDQRCLRVITFVSASVFLSFFPPGPWSLSRSRCTIGLS